jgi:hypothetical protein
VSLSLDWYRGSMYAGIFFLMGCLIVCSEFNIFVLNAGAPPVSSAELTTSHLQLSLAEI